MSKKKKSRYKATAGTSVLIKLSAADKAALRAMADERSVSLSELLREAPLRERQLASLNARLLLELRMTRTAGMLALRRWLVELGQSVGEMGEDELAALLGEDSGMDPKIVAASLAGQDSDEVLAGRFDRFRRGIGAAMARFGWPVQVMRDRFDEPTMIRASDFVEQIDYSTRLEDGRLGRATLDIVELALQRYDEVFGQHWPPEDEALFRGEMTLALAARNPDGEEVDGLEVLESAMTNSVVRLGPDVRR